MVGEKTMLDIERAVCSAVSDVMVSVSRPPVGVEELYCGKKNVPLGRVVSRNFCFHLMHSHYGFSYTVIAQRSGMNVSSVMRCVRKYHHLVHCDALYRRVYEHLKEGSYCGW